MAEHDQLTDLPHGAALQKHLETALGEAGATGESLAVLRLDLDRFKEANDLFGQSVGDDALRAVADRFRVAADGAYVARSGGDEFTFVIDGPQPSGAESLAERLRESIESEISVAEHSIQLGASIGVAVFPSDGGDVASLMANADAASNAQRPTAAEPCGSLMARPTCVCGRRGRFNTTCGPRSRASSSSTTSRNCQSLAAWLDLKRCCAGNIQPEA